MSVGKCDDKIISDLMKKGYTRKKALELLQKHEGKADPKWWENWLKKGMGVDKYRKSKKKKVGRNKYRTKDGRVLLRTPPEGLNIKEFQMAVNRAGGNLKVDGIWGPKTANTMWKYGADILKPKKAVKKDVVDKPKKEKRFEPSWDWDKIKDVKAREMPKSQPKPKKQDDDSWLRLYFADNPEDRKDIAKKAGIIRKAEGTEAAKKYISQEVVERRNRFKKQYLGADKKRRELGKEKIAKGVGIQEKLGGLFDLLQNEKDKAKKKEIIAKMKQIQKGDK